MLEASTHRFGEASSMVYASHSLPIKLKATQETIFLAPCHGSWAGWSKHMHLRTLCDVMWLRILQCMHLKSLHNIYIAFCCIQFFSWPFGVGSAQTSVQMVFSEEDDRSLSRQPSKVQLQVEVKGIQWIEMVRVSKLVILPITKHYELSSLLPGCYQTPPLIHLRGQNTIKPRCSSSILEVF